MKYLQDLSIHGKIILVEVQEMNALMHGNKVKVVNFEGNYIQYYFVNPEMDLINRFM